MTNKYFNNDDPNARMQNGRLARADEVEDKLDAVHVGFDGVEVDTKRSIKFPTDITADQELPNAGLRANQIIGFDASGNLQLQPGVGNWRGDWLTATAYAVRDVVRDPVSKNLYISEAVHTSGVLATDIASGKMSLLIDVAEVEAAQVAAEAARDAALASQIAAAASDASALAHELKALQWAEEPENSQVEAGKYSALHHSAKASAQRVLAETARAGAETAEAGALVSASNAATSEANAAASDASALAHEQKAQKWAEELKNVEVEPGKFSAYHWAQKAQEFATGQLIYMGAWDASTGVYPSSPVQGYFYKISVAGTISGTVYDVGDAIIYNGATWDKIDNTEKVTSVGGYIGDITASQLLAAIKTVDGAGSGLDADLLDGLSSAQFLRSDTDDTMTGLLVFQRSNNMHAYFENTGGGHDLAVISAAGGMYFRPYPSGVADTARDFLYNFSNSRWEFDTVPYAAGNVMWHAGNDGSGSGLDADTLDGYNASVNEAASTVVVRDASGYIHNSYFNMSANDISTTAPSRIAVETSSDNYLRWQTPTNFLNSQGVWRSGNDGSGSGLDADLLDGLQASQLMRLDADNARAAGNITQFYNVAGETATSQGSNKNLVVYQNSANADAYMTFHVGGDFAGYFGLSGATNDLFWGGWSVGAVKHTIYHQGNDGAGSGLDADLLDGQQGSYYLAASSYTASDVLNKIKTVDGTGSGLDADTLDGLNPDQSPNANTIVRRDANGYINVNYLNMNHVDIATAATRVAIEVSNDKWLRWQTISQFIGNHGIWTASNDGAASSLDAGLLAGQGPSYYKNASNLDSGIVPYSRLSGTYGISITGTAAVGAATVGQAQLKTSQGSVGYASGNFGQYTLPGGSYGFTPDTRFPTTIDNNQLAWFGGPFVDGVNLGGGGWWPSQTNKTAYAQYLFLHSGKAGGYNWESSSAYAQQRYITASPPYDLGNGAIPVFIFVTVDIATGKINHHYAAEAPPWAYNGPTDIRADFYDKKTGKGYKEKRIITTNWVPDGLGDFEPVIESKIEIIEVTQAIKNADMLLISQPFGMVSENEIIVMLDPHAPQSLAALEMLQASDPGVAEFLSHYVKVDNTPRDFITPPGVMGLRPTWK